MNEEGKVGAGWHVVGLGGGEEGLGKLATVWDGEVVGMRGGGQSAPEDRKVLFISDSQAAIAAVRKAGQTCKARTGEFKEVVEEVRAEEAEKSGTRRRQICMGEGTRRNSRQ